MQFFILHRALGAILDQNECIFFAKKRLSSLLTREKKSESGQKKKVKKKHSILDFLASSHVQLIHFAKKLSQNGKVCPQQGQK